MKTLISLLATMVFVVAFGTAFADEWPADQSRLFGGRDKVTDLPDPYGDFPSTSGEFYGREIPLGATSAAPGGVREEASQEEKGGRFFDNRPGRDNVTDLPDPYGDY